MILSCETQYATLPEPSLDDLSDLASESDTFEETAERLFDSFGQIIPYDRIGIALLSPDRENIELRWVKSRRPAKFLKVGFTQKFLGSSLEKILIDNHPRIISNLDQYLGEHPGSDNSRRAVADGIRSSLTCPLRGANGPIGVIFFSSYFPGTYSSEHTHIYSLIASTIATSVQRKIDLASHEALAGRETFYRKALHDLRTPLNVLKGLSDLALKNKFGPLPPELEKPLGAIQRQTEMMTSLLEHIQDGLDLGTIDFCIKKQSVALSEYLDTIAMAAESLTFAKSMTFRMSRSVDLPLTAYFDPQRLSQVIGNLLSNAIKFSRPKTTITLDVSLMDSNLHFALTDQGIGISRPELPNLFAPDSCASKGTQTAFERCQGLGLTIVKKIVNDHGGKVWAESQLGVGSTFHFTLPYRAE
ncbi:MAG TPA: GAF domain-containing sensor histidine kinase [Bdellovibrionota bacterium]|jgi:signal transduction histidine kinase|nr:GAF domain-containing sensor histidine kinase [Bdellovibrionota bacterium]